MSVLLIFVDGIGLGEPRADVNPLATAPMPFVRGLLGGRALVRDAAEDVAGERPGSARLVAVDACLGVPGLPQSATGQTAMLTGINAARTLGRHLSGYPTPTLVHLLQARGLFRRLREVGLRATFANAFTDEYFAAVETGSLRHSATTTAVLSAGLPVRRLDDLLAGRAVFHDVTGESLRSRGYDVPVITPAEAGRRLAALAAEHDFTLFEHFLTDLAGHAQDWGEAQRLLALLDELLAAVAAHADLTATTVIMLSDHGNLEDLSVKTHTRNPVPGLFFGPGSAFFAAAVRSLCDIAPAVFAYLTSPGMRPAPAGGGPGNE